MYLDKRYYLRPTKETTSQGDDLTEKKQLGEQLSRRTKVLQISYISHMLGSGIINKLILGGSHGTLYSCLVFRMLMRNRSPKLRTSFMDLLK